MRNKIVLGVGLAAVIGAAGAGWVAGRQIKSPAEVASKTAPPAPSVIVAPVEKRALSTEVVTRGAVRYGAPQSVSLATSNLKKGTDIVSTPPIKGAELREGAVAMAASGRPIFVMQGDKPSYRDIGPGSSGTDVAQLEKALARLGYDPGAVDGNYDDQTASAVSAMYAAAGWAPFGPTDEQQQAQRGAQNDDFSASGDLVSQQEAYDTANGALVTARERVAKASRALDAAKAADQAALTKAEHERLTAAAEVAAKSAALDGAIDGEEVAKVALDEALAASNAPTKTELATLRANAKQATRAVGTARADLAAAQAGANAVVTPPADANAKEAAAELDSAQAEVTRAQRAVELAKTKVDLADQHASKVALALGSKLGVQVPADEVVFFPNLPLRVDSVKVAAGEPVSGAVMTVTNSRLAVDGALSLDDTRVVKTGAPVTIAESDLGIKLSGTVTAVAAAPGTDGADPQRFHIEVTPNEAPTSLVGASVVMSITVGSTGGEVLALPVSALSVAADGTSRVQVQAKDRTTSFVTVTPGLTANGFVAVTAVGSQLNAGDLVVVGSGTGATAATGGAAGSSTSAPSNVASKSSAATGASSGSGGSSKPNDSGASTTQKGGG